MYAENANKTKKCKHFCTHAKMDENVYCVFPSLRYIFCSLQNDFQHPAKKPLVNFKIRESQRFLLIPEKGLCDVDKKAL